MIADGEQGIRGRVAPWYPDRGLQFGRFDLTFHYPKELDLVATGGGGVSVEGESRVTRGNGPIRMAGFNLGLYDRTKIVRGRRP